MSTLISAKTPLSANIVPFACSTAFWQIRLFTVCLDSEQKTLMLPKALKAFFSACKITIIYFLPLLPTLNRLHMCTSLFKLYSSHVAKGIVWIQYTSHLHFMQQHTAVCATPE